MMDQFKDITPEAVAGGHLPSMFVNQVSQGDFVFLPFGFFFCEKAIKSVSLTIKVACTLSHQII